MSKLSDEPLFKERNKRKEDEKRRNKGKEILSRKAILLTDLAAVFSKRKLTIKGISDIVDDLIELGWTKKEFQKRKWIK